MATAESAESTGSKPGERRTALWGQCAGTTAIEYALLAPALFMFLIGTAEMGRLVWTQVTIDYAASAAARCAAVDVVTCATTGNIQSYGSAQTFGLSAPAADFTVTANPCGQQVDVAYPFQFLTSFVVGGQITLTAHACAPSQA